MKKLILAILITASTAWAQTTTVTLEWVPPAGNTVLSTNAIIFNGVTNTVTVYPDYSGYAIYYSPVLLPSLASFSRITNASPASTNLMITGLPNGGNKFFCITSTNMLGIESTPSNLIQVGPGNSQKIQVIAK